MTRRHDFRRIKIHWTYSIPEAAKLLGVHKHTVSRWIAGGLPLIERKRPFLVQGNDLRAFLKARQPRKQPCRAGEIYCVRCRAPKRPAGDMVDCDHKTPTTVLLTGICPTCESLIHRVANVAALASICDGLLVTHKPRQQRIADSPVASRNVAFRKEHK
jgi:excisionase family DNA binding protein